MYFLKSHLIMNAPLSVGAAANPPKSNDWKWATDTGAFYLNYFVPVISISQKISLHC